MSVADPTLEYTDLVICPDMGFACSECPEYPILQQGCSGHCLACPRLLRCRCTNPRGERAQEARLAEAQRLYVAQHCGDMGIIHLPIDELVIGLYDVRRYRDPAFLAALGAQIAQEGLFQPVSVVRRDDDRYYVIQGSSRVLALRYNNSQVPGEFRWRTIPCIPKPITAPVIEMKRIAFRENVARMEMDLHDTIAFIMEWHEHTGASLRQMARDLGISHEAVRQYLKLGQDLEQLAPAERAALATKSKAEIRAALGLGQRKRIQLEETETQRLHRALAHLAHQAGITVPAPTSNESAEIGKGDLLQLVQAVEQHPRGPAAAT
ncbi:MAG: ParB N-terminal domain-containing protein [Chloroflexi bacterium]|nr:ParB N-terminal domain-containing protein [Chloroflexota bacterium]